jgi:hypothetical protein
VARKPSQTPDFRFVISDLAGTPHLQQRAETRAEILGSARLGHEGSADDFQGDENFRDNERVGDVKRRQSVGREHGEPRMGGRK